MQTFNPTAKNPWIVANLSSLEEALAAQQQGADAIEFRCDLAIEDKNDPIKIIKEIRKATALPILGTIRRSGDGGSWFYAFEGDESKRIQLFRNIIPYIDAIDVEIDSDIKEEVTGFARDKGLKVISSYHNFLITEKKEDILKNIKQAQSAGGDIIKLAYMSSGNEDVLFLFKVLKEYLNKNSTPMTLIGMGPVGTATRLIFPCFGSCMTYGYIEGARHGASGQMPIKVLRKYLNDMQPKVLSSSPDEEILESILNYEFSGVSS